MALVFPLDDFRSDPETALFQGARAGAGAALTFFAVDAAPGGGPDLHLHPYPEVFLVQEGQATFTVGDEQVAVGGGHVVEVPAETPHRFENTGSGVLRLVAMHPSGELVQTDL